jgi:nucleoside-diphosphate-sugar epimerase
MSRVLLTGGCGFVGRHFAKALLERGDEVLVVDNLTTGSGAIAVGDGWPLFEPRDFRTFDWNEVDCRDWFRENPSETFDYIFHLAAVVGGRLTIERNPMAVAEDLAIDSDMWRWARSARPTKVVAFSSSAAYPIKLQGSHTDVIRLRESDIDFEAELGIPDLTYGWAKLTCEYLAQVAWTRDGIDSAVYRPFSGYGEDQDLTYPFPSICQRAIASRDHSVFQVWGSGLQSRDFIHIDDCVQGVLGTVDKLSGAAPLNLSTGEATTFLDLARQVTDLVGWQPEIVGDASMPEGVQSRCGDTTKQQRYGFEPSISLRAGIDRCLNYLDQDRLGRSS